MEPAEVPATAAQAWAHFARGALPQAIAAARTAVAANPTDWGATAALGFFLFKAGQIEQARAVLLPARALARHVAPLHWYSGYVLEHAGEREAAAQAFEQACTLDPQLDECAFALAWVLHDLSRAAQALTWSRRALAAARTPARLQQLAWLLQCTGQERDAVTLWQEAIDRLPADDPGQPVLHLHLVQCLALIDQDTRAEALLHHARQRWPHDAPLAAQAMRRLRARGDTDGALQLAHAMVQSNPDDAHHWYQLGVLLHDQGALDAADHALQQVQQRDLGNTDALVRRARIQHGWKHYEGTRWLLGLALERAPRNAAAIGLLAQTLLDQDEHAQARRLLVPHLRAGSMPADLTRLLALAHARAGRPGRASRLLHRLVHQNPEHLQAWRSLAWLALERGETDEALRAVHVLLQRAPEDAAVHIQASCVMLSAGQLSEAQRWAEHAVAHHPAHAHAWHALAQLRLQQRRLDEARSAIDEALQRAPDDVSCLRLQGRVLLAGRHHDLAQQAFERALALAPKQLTLYLESAQALQAAGRLSAAVRVAEAALALRPGWLPALLARARGLVEMGADAARPACEQLLHADRRSPEVATVLLRLWSLGDADARRLLGLVPADVLRAQWRQAIEQAVHNQGHAVLQRLVQLAIDTLDTDPWLLSAAHYAASLSMQSTGAALARQARDGYNALKLRSGLARLPVVARKHPQETRPRIAYVASQRHQHLLVPVLAAHDAAQVEVFLYTDHPPTELPPDVHVHPLAAERLAASCAANRIDVVIDAGGLHPFEGQFEVLHAYAQRIAPVQVGWLGCWGSAGGLFDALLTDAVSVPAAHAAQYAEEVVHLAGGQWCWTPPAAAPGLGPPPAVAQRHITFGVTSRGLKLHARCLQAFARVVASVTGSTIRFIGEIAHDWPWQRDVLARMLAEGVAPERVLFDPFIPRADYLRWCGRIDLLLDSFPGNGGLSLLDPLWMGVPCITLAGSWAGARQGASLLHALELAQWVADSEQEFVAKAVALASDVHALAQWRSGMRARILASPLVDGRRVAAQIEAACLGWAHAAADMVAATDAKGRVRAHARRMLDHWLALPRTIDLPCPEEPPELSVIVVLYGQAGLSLRTLQALADQRGARFETIVVDNASDDRTPELLGRLRGAHVLRNADNHGFLRAARQGAQAATGRFLAFLNSDAILQPDAVREALRLMRSDAGIGVLGGRVVLSAGGLQEAGNLLFQDGSAGGIGRGADPFDPAAQAARDTDYVSGVFLVTPACVWRMLDGFDPVFAPAYYEDTDYCLRVWQAGLRVVYAPTVLLEHLEWGSATGRSATELMERNRATFHARHRWLLHDRPTPRALPLDGDRWRSPHDRPRRPRVLVIDNEVPYGYKGGGLPRARWMLQALDGWAVTLLPLWEPHDHVRQVYDALPASVEVALGYGADGLEAFLEQRAGVYDVLLVSRPPNLRHVQALRRRRHALFAGMRLVYDAEALFALREIAQAAVLGKPLSAPARRARLAQELALAKDASDVLVVSQRDAQHFQNAGLRTHVLCHSTPVRRHAPGPQDRCDLLFVGALHPGTPNEDGLLWFVREVMPLLRARLGTAPVLDVVGVCLSARVMAMADGALRIHGPQAALEPYYDRARVFVAPVRFAAGVPAKVIEAAAAGVPVVASSLLVRQLQWRDGTDIRGARDARSFAEAVARLYTDAPAWQAQQQAAWQQCAQRYDPELFASTLRRVLGAPA